MTLSKRYIRLHELNARIESIIRFEESPPQQHEGKIKKTAQLGLMTAGVGWIGKGAMKEGRIARKAYQATSELSGMSRFREILRKINAPRTA